MSSRFLALVGVAMLAIASAIANGPKKARAHLLERLKTLRILTFEVVKLDAKKGTADDSTPRNGGNRKPNSGSNHNYRVRWLNDNDHRSMTGRIVKGRIHNWDVTKMEGS